MVPFSMFTAYGGMSDSRRTKQPKNSKHQIAETILTSVNRPKIKTVVLIDLTICGLQRHGQMN